MALPVAYVIDTNVIRDLRTCHDTLRVWQAGALFERAYRFQRARDAFLAALSFNDRGVRTLSLHAEPVRELRDPAARRITDDGTRFVYHFNNTVKTWCLPNWVEEAVTNCDAGLRGTGCDTRLLEIAAEHQCPVVTTEGVPSSIINRSKPRLPRHARRRGIVTMAPQDVWRAHPNLQASYEAFRRALSEHAHPAMRTCLVGYYDWLWSNDSLVSTHPLLSSSSQT